MQKDTGAAKRQFRDYYMSQGKRNNQGNLNRVTAQPLGSILEAKPLRQ
jgi:hypothetical protein